MSTGRPFLLVLLLTIVLYSFRESILTLRSVDTLISESETISSSSSSSSSSLSTKAALPATATAAASSPTATASTSTVSASSDSDYISTLPKHKNKNDEYKNKYYKHNFSYDHERWEKSNNGNGPRIVVMCGPHKTASSTMQAFFARIAGQTISVVNDNNNISGNDNKNGNSNSDVTTRTNILTPHPTVTKWVWPLGVKEEYVHRIRNMGKAKFYAAMASFVTGNRYPSFFMEIEVEDKEESKVWVAEYFRSLFRYPFKEGKNIVIGAEAFDTLVRELRSSHSSSSSSASAGEETHLSPGSSEMIDAMTNLFPWNITTETVPPLRMEDIEVEINYRTPRIDHVASLWHQVGHYYGNTGVTMKNFLIKSDSQSNSTLTVVNSLALALQFVRKGIKTTILDMAGVEEHKFNQGEQQQQKDEEEEKNHNANNITVVGGLNGVVACDILRMGRNKNQDDGGGLWCDSNSKLYMAGNEIQHENLNKKSDEQERDLSEEQMQAIDRVFEEYDCGVWQHLQKYQEQGLLRILYPSEHRFSTCNNLERSRDISFPTLVETVRGIAKSNDSSRKREKMNGTK